MSVTAFRLILYKLRQPEPVKNAGRGGVRTTGVHFHPLLQIFSYFGPSPFFVCRILSVHMPTVAYVERSMCG